MKQYIGTKIVQAEPEMATKDQPGYKVVYADGYESWSPKSVFEEAYRESSGMPLGLAIEALKKGAKAARSGWNGKGMFIFLVPSSRFMVNRAPLLGIYPEGTMIDYRAHIDIKNVDGSISTWAPSNSDALAEDWLIIE